MALTKFDPLNAEAGRPDAKTASAGLPGPQQHRFVYDPSHNDEPEIGIAPRTVDMHKNTLLSPRLVPPDHPQAALSVKAGEIVEIAASDAQLADFLSAHNLFRRARHSDLSKG